MPDPIRFAVVGCGALAQGQHLPNIVRSDNMSLEACCDLSDANLETCKQRFSPAKLSKDFHETIADPAVDAICLAATEKLRLPVIEAAAKAGKPIYVEKPLARSLEEMIEIQRVVHASGIPFCIGHNRRSSPAMVEAQRLFREHMQSDAPCPWRYVREPEQWPPGLPDDLAGMAVRINDDWQSWKAWVFDPEQAPHGPMLFEMTHFTDICNWFLDDEPESVTALETKPFNHGVVIRYRGGALATISMCSTGTFGYPKELYEAMGRGGLVAVDHMVEVRTAGLADTPAQIAYPRLGAQGRTVEDDRGIAGWLADKREACERAAAAGDPMKQFEAAEPDKGHARHLERFVEQIRGDGPVVCGVDEALRASRIAFAAIRSSAEGRTVSLSELPGANT